MEDARARCRVLVLGGYGHFGARIARALAADPRVEVIVAGRSATRQGSACFAALPPAQQERLAYADLDIASSPALPTSAPTWSSTPPARSRGRTWAWPKPAC